MIHVQLMYFAPAPRFDIHAEIVFELRARLAERQNNQIQARSAGEPAGIRIPENVVGGHDALIQDLHIGRVEIFTQRGNQEIDQQAMVKPMKDCSFNARFSTAAIPREQPIGGHLDRAVIIRNLSQFVFEGRDQFLGVQ